MSNIKDLIHVVRGKQVMLDSDVASLFQYETKELNRNVKNNIERFPENYCFQLSEEEYKNLKCKFITSSSNKNYGGRRYLPYVFTEYGITMLAGILKSKKAVEISIEIVNSFIEMRKFIISNSDVLKRLTMIEYKQLEHDDKFNVILSKLEGKPDVKERLFYDGEIYDAYSLIVEILKEAKKEIVIIDNYVDKRILDILTFKQKDVDVFIFTNNLKLNDLDLEKFISQYGEVKISYTNRFHDRFIILDGKVLYHVGASIKDLGKKCFGITRIKDIEYLDKLNKIIDEHHIFC
jgi:ORF6N domain.